MTSTNKIPTQPAKLEVSTSTPPKKENMAAKQCAYVLGAGSLACAGLSVEQWFSAKHYHNRPEMHQEILYDRLEGTAERLFKKEYKKLINNVTISKFFRNEHRWGSVVFPLASALFAAGAAYCWHRSQNEPDDRFPN